MNSLLGDVLSFLPVDAAALALEDLWTIVLQLGLGVVAWSQGVVLGQLAVAEELVAAEVEGEGEAGVGGRLHGDGDVGEVLETLQAIISCLMSSSNSWPNSSRLVLQMPRSVVSSSSITVLSLA